MRKTAFVLSGQGAQYPGMGRGLYEKSPAARDVFDMAELFRKGTIGQCFAGSIETLSQTINTQPCMFCADLAPARALLEYGIIPAAVSGFSIGELPALALSGVLSDADAFRLTCLRANLMQNAAQKYPGSMAAVLHMEKEALISLCENTGDVWAVNFNAPGQIVVAGTADAIMILSKKAAQQGARVIPLNVGGAFHSPLMHEAAQELFEMIETFSFNKPAFTLYSNVTGIPYDGNTDNMKTLLAKQAESPVLWMDTIVHMAKNDITTFVETGPGKTLCGLIKKICPGAEIFHVETPEDLEIVCQQFKNI